MYTFWLNENDRTSPIFYIVTCLYSLFAIGALQCYKLTAIIHSTLPAYLFSSRSWKSTLVWCHRLHLLNTKPAVFVSHVQYQFQSLVRQDIRVVTKTYYIHLPKFESICYSMSNILRNCINRNNPIFGLGVCGSVYLSQYIVIPAVIIPRIRFIQSVVCHFAFQ